MPSYCSNYGEEIPDDTKKCPKCGAEFEGEEIAEKRPEIKAESAKTPETDGVSAYLPKKIKKKPLFERLWFLILTASIFVGFGILCLIEGASSITEIADFINNPSAIFLDGGAVNGFFVFDVLVLLIAIIYIIFGIYFSIPGKKGEIGYIVGGALAGLPLIFGTYDLISSLIEGYGEIPIKLIRVLVAIVGAAIIVARWKSLKNQSV
jgi:hypothetical protein